MEITLRKLAAGVRGMHKAECYRQEVTKFEKESQGKYVRERNKGNYFHVAARITRAR